MTEAEQTLIRVLLADGVALLPTDTIYGLHVAAGSDAAVRKLVELKGRDGEKPFIVLGASLEQLENLGVQFDARAREVLEDVWPGPLTVVVPLESPIAASRGTSTLAVRVPALPWLRSLLEQTGPLASTSANRSGEPAVTTPAELSHDLHASLDAVYDAGRLEAKASTIVALTGDEPRLIREGDPFFTQKVWKRLRKSL